MRQNLRYTLRVLGKTPAFTLAAVAILALAIGANTAMFSILEAWLLKPLHFKDSDQIVIALRRDVYHQDAIPVFAFYRDYLDWKRPGAFVSGPERHVLAGVHGDRRGRSGPLHWHGRDSRPPGDAGRQR